MSVAKKETLEMLGEMVREGGLLVAVFGFLEGAQKPTTSISWFVGVGLVSILMIALGVVVERYRP